jgi:hypothetical protein
MTIIVPIFVLISLLVAGCSSAPSTAPSTANCKAIDCAYSGIREVALGINGRAVQHYDISDDEEICRSIFLWLDGHRHGWRVCDFTIPGNLFISGKFFQMNINDSHVGILWANAMREKYRWYYRPRDDEVDALLEDIKRWIIGSSKEEVITSKSTGRQRGW